MVQREKNVRDYNSTDFVKYFAKRYSSTQGKEYPVIFARDCSIMLKVMRKFFEAERPLKDIFKFIDEMFDEYPKRRRLSRIDLNWLFSMTPIYLNVKKPSKSNKAKAPEMELDEEMKAWLKAEKAKLQKPDGAS